MMNSSTSKNVKYFCFQHPHRISWHPIKSRNVYIFDVVGDMERWRGKGEMCLCYRAYDMNGTIIHVVGDVALQNSCLPYYMESWLMKIRWKLSYPPMVRINRALVSDERGLFMFFGLDLRQRGFILFSHFARDINQH
jgi:hypothetical protein